MRTSPLWTALLPSACLVACTTSDRVPVTTAAAELAVAAPVRTCASLKGTDLSAIGGTGSTIVSAAETTSDGVAVCQVDGRLAPEVNFRVLLPTRTWTQRYLQVGCGGLCGQITLRSGASDGCQVLNDGGFVMAATDMGHGAADREGRWGLDGQKRVDFAYRAQHITALAAKVLIRTFYGRAERYSYFNGCSDGGREALMEAERFPDDFDGVIAGAPAMLFQVQNTLYHGWQARSNTDVAGRAILLSSKLPVLHRAVIAACDAHDGLKDGLIAEPARCRFDVASVTCKSRVADMSACLSPAEAHVARRFYDGPRDSATGSYLTAGQPLPGSELEWQGVYVADSAEAGLMSTNAALPVLRYLAFNQPRPEFALADLEFSTRTLDALRPRHALYDSTMADLSAFRRSGGKLIMWHGLADPHISPANSVAMHQAMARTMGQATLDGFERLYLLPGVSHCSGGRGPSNLDLLSAMMAWVEHSEAPDAILTSSTSRPSGFGQPDFNGESGRRAGGPPPRAPLAIEPLPAMTRPIYPYPHVARYTGRGDWTNAANWTRGRSTQIVNVRSWTGADLFGPYRFADH